MLRLPRVYSSLGRAPEGLKRYSSLNSGFFAVLSGERMILPFCTFNSTDLPSLLSSRSTFGIRMPWELPILQWSLSCNYIVATTIELVNDYRQHL